MTTPADWTPGPGIAALRTHAPEVAAALDLLPIRPVTGGTTAGTTAGTADVLTAFAEQFEVDVSMITPEQRAALIEVLGPHTRPFLGRLYVADWVPRARRALDQLFGAPSAWPAGDGSDEAAGPGGADPWPALDDLWRAIARLRVLDPVTTEVLRLRQARQHRCRICQSLRSRSALAAGVDEETLDEIDHYPDSALSERHKTGLAVVDALVWEPTGLGPDLVAAVRRHYTPTEAVELVLDLLRNAANKVAVALGTDEAHVSEGTEVYDVLPDGSVAFGLSAP
ncbi:carboxymuconolactone decarboxylase family protein [Nocardioides albidus]|uniref:Carboxymuconolactone decarboxylase family protein n=1 Tax=Nocardioides albidus TaxID=1517589 RepID=A0A5C4W1B6_9ACTN|nr:carboxymuconolactone decarboxylase family protein [Nocardioides albidus]TNM41968.1 carboxymuconolactone decarboxylase family protein [Nocardioides albidus]